MLKTVIVVSNQLGLHARAAAQLVRLAESFQSEIKICRTDNEISADAKSILDVLTLAAAKGVRIEIQAAGEDEKAALPAIEQLFADGFGES